MEAAFADCAHRPARAAENERRHDHAVETADEIVRDPARRWPFLCECDSADCGDILSATLAEYETVRAHPGRFLLRPGHELGLDAAVVERHPGFVVVQLRS